MEAWRDSGHRHCLRGPSGATGSSSTSIQVSKDIFLASILPISILGIKIWEVQTGMENFSVADPGSSTFFILTPGSGMEKKPDPAQSSQVIFPRAYQQFLG